MRPEKNLLREEIQNELVQANAFLVARYNKLDPEMAWKMSGRLKKNNCYFTVIKKRVLSKAIQEAKLPLEAKKFPGHIGVLLLQGDPLAGIKSFFAINEELNQNFEVQEALYNGQAYSSSEIEAIAKLPSLPVLRSQFLSVMESPMQQLLQVIQGLLTSLLYGLENKIKKIE